MDWANQSEGNNENKLASGYHKVTVKKAIRFKKDGSELESAKGPFLMLIFEDIHGFSATASYWLTQKAAWKLANTCKAMGFDLAAMTAQSVEIENFHDEKFCKAQFEKRTCIISVTQQGQYTNADVVDEDDLAPDVLVSMNSGAVPAPTEAGTPPPADADDIPF